MPRSPHDKITEALAKADAKIERLTAHLEAAQLDRDRLAAEIETASTDIGGTPPADGGSTGTAGAGGHDATIITDSKD